MGVKSSGLCGLATQGGAIMKALRRYGPRTAWLGAVLLLAAGCHTLPTRIATDKASRPTGAVSQIAVAWSEAVLRQDNVPVSQGFAGKVYLFGPDSSAPVTSPGKFTIYAYDETAHTTNGTAPKEGHVKPDMA